MRSLLLVLLLLVPVSALGQCAGGACARPARVAVVPPGPPLPIFYGTIPVLVPTPVRVYHPTYVREVPYRYWPGPAYFYVRPHIRQGFFGRWFGSRNRCR